MPLDFSKNVNYLIPAGEYEVLLESAEFKVARTGTKYINLKLVIRKDVNQECQGKIIWDSIWASKNKPDEYNYDKIKAILKTQEGTDLYKVNFEDYDEVVQHFTGLTFRVKVEVEAPNENHENEKNFINKDRGYLKSLVAPKTLESTSGVVESNNLSSIGIDDDDLPF